jgi:asparagine N-glycosylation enzyme membrane subunit Stt3
VAKVSYTTMPFKLPLPEEQLLLIATGINAVLVVLAFLLKPGGYGFSGVGWSWGSFVGLIAAIVAAFPTAAPAIKARRM